MNVLILDIETTTLEKNNRVANPWYNSIVAYCLKQNHNTVIEHIDNIPFDVDLRDSIVKNILKFNTNILIAFNAKFELLYLYPHKDFQNWIKTGGKIYCPQLAEYFLSDLQNKWAALRNTAVTYYNCKEREKNMELYWEEGYDTDQIPTNLVIEDVKNDVLDTETIYNRQQLLINKKGNNFKNLLEIQMDFLLATTEMEFNGIKIDTNFINTEKSKLETERLQIEEEINKIIKEYWNENIS